MLNKKNFLSLALYDSIDEWIDRSSNRDPMYDLVVSYFIMLRLLGRHTATGLRMGMELGIGTVRGQMVGS